LFLKGPFGPAIYVIAKDKNTNKIIGSQAAIPYQISNRNQDIIKTAKSEDTLIHPNYRGQKISTKMYDLLFQECKRKGIQLIWGFSALDRPFLRAGFEIPLHIQQAYFALSPKDTKAYFKKRKAPESFIDKIFLNALSQMTILKSRMGLVKKRTLSEFEIVIEQTRNSENIQQSFKLLNEMDYTILQNLAFQEWRFKHHPNLKSSLSFFLKKESHVYGKIQIDIKGKEASISQFYYEESLKDKLIVDFVFEVINKLREENLVVLSSWCFDKNSSNRKQMSLLKKAGFFVLNRGMHMVWKPLDPALKLSPEQILLSKEFGL
jgi:GNAT superfamily N-acetyltransferase